MANRKKDVQITISADKDTREIRVRLEPGEIIVERTPVEPPNQKQGESYERRY